jgi:hypothetical protein
MITRMCQRIAPLALLGLAATLSGCDAAELAIDGEKGVPLAALEQGGTAPPKLVLSSGDTVILAEGKSFALAVEGPESESLRFVRNAEMIGIARKDGWKGDRAATIRITMPPPSEVVIAGSGTVRAPTLARNAEINIAGSGSVEFARLDADKLEIKIGGSGTVTGAGTAKELGITIGGSGKLALEQLKADKAELSIGGSGDVAFASDGTVKARIAGAGEVRVTGRAKCTVTALGSGTLTCNPAPATPAQQPAA